MAVKAILRDKCEPHPLKYYDNLRLKEQLEQQKLEQTRKQELRSKDEQLMEQIDITPFSRRATSVFSVINNEKLELSNDIQLLRLLQQKLHIEQSVFVTQRHVLRDNIMHIQAILAQTRYLHLQIWSFLRENSMSIEELRQRPEGKVCLEHLESAQQNAIQTYTLMKAALVVESRKVFERHFDDGMVF